MNVWSSYSVGILRRVMCLICVILSCIVVVSCMTGPTIAQKESGLQKVIEGASEGDQVGLARRLYYTEIWDAIREQWVFPEHLKAQRLETTLVVVIRRDGKVLDLRVEKSSGSEAYDESARPAVRKAEPLPPFPAIYSPAQEEIKLRFHPVDR